MSLLPPSPLYPGMRIYAPTNLWIDIIPKNKCNQVESLQNMCLISLKKNNKFKDPFHYNMSGLTIKHDGLVLIKNKRDSFKNRSNEIDGATQITVSSTYDFSLEPKYVVSEIRKESPSYLAGIKEGDEILSVNGTQAYQYNLYQSSAHQNL